MNKQQLTIHDSYLLDENFESERALPIHESYQHQHVNTAKPLMYEHLTSKEFIDYILDESTEPATMNEAFPFLIPLLTTVGPKLASLAANIAKSGVIQKGVKAAGQALAQNVDGKNLIAAAKQAAQAAGKAFTPEVLSQLIAGLVNGDTGQNSANLANDQKAAQIAQTMQNGGNQQQAKGNQQQNGDAQQQNGNGQQQNGNGQQQAPAQA